MVLLATAVTVVRDATGISPPGWNFSSLLIFFKDSNDNDNK